MQALSVSSSWNPLGSSTIYRLPEVGSLVARDFAVWRVTSVTDAGEVHLQHVGGARPQWAPAGVDGFAGSVEPGEHGAGMWHVYRSGRWPMCSCCGEPMPCRAEVVERDAVRDFRRIDQLASRQPGCCWGCGQPITARQRSVSYAGENLDLPGGPDVVAFHTRRECFGTAAAYERRWVAVDPRRQRAITYPRCSGILVVHGDGSSHCRSGTDAVGVERTGEPDCRGHLTHDHGVEVACYVGERWTSAVLEYATSTACLRGCRYEGHPGTRHTPRPWRRTDAISGGTR